MNIATKVVINSTTCYLPRCLNYVCSNEHRTFPTEIYFISTMLIRFYQEKPATTYLGN